VARDSTSIEIAALLQAAIESASLRIPLCGLVQEQLWNAFHKGSVAPQSPKSFTPRQMARILWDFTYLCWANPKNANSDAKSRFLGGVSVCFRSQEGFGPIGKDHFESVAAEEQLQIIRQGVDAWNEWREKNPKLLRPDLVKANLSRANLSGANLHEAVLTEAVLGLGEPQQGPFR
jgi:hypothetical protein